MNTFGAKLFRAPPKMETHRYKTYQIAAPVGTHYRKATCAEVNCEAYRNGWTFREADLDSRLLYIVTHSGKKWTRKRLTDDGDWYLVFEAGQSCFAAPSHRVSLERPELYLVGRGDWRSYVPREARRLSPENWLDDCRTHQATLAAEIAKG